MYFCSVLQVLLPTNSLDTVPPPGSGLTGGQPAGQPGIGSLFPGLMIGNKQTKATGRCSQAFLDAANKQNLTFLVQVCFFGLLTGTDDLRMLLPWDRQIFLRVFVGISC